MLKTNESSIQVIHKPTPGLGIPDSQESTVSVQLAAIVIEVLKLDLDPRSLVGDVNLYELGLESLNIVELLAAIEKVFDIVIDVEDLSNELFTCIDNLAEFVRNKLHGDA